jgi:hypothetical protein
MPNQIGPHLEQRIVAFALAHPAFGPGGSAPSWPWRSGGGLRISAHGVWRLLVGLGRNMRAKRLALVARPRDPYERVPSPRPASTRRTNWRTLSAIVSAMTFRRRAGSSEAPPMTGSRSTATSRAQRTPRGSAEATVAAASCTALAKAGRGACFPGRAPAGSVAGVALAPDEQRESRGAVGARLLRGKATAPRSSSLAGSAALLRAEGHWDFVWGLCALPWRVAAHSRPNSRQELADVQEVPAMARPGLERGTPRFSGSRGRSTMTGEDLQTRLFQRVLSRLDAVGYPRLPARLGLCGRVGVPMSRGEEGPVGRRLTPRRRGAIVFVAPPPSKAREARLLLGITVAW